MDVSVLTMEKTLWRKYSLSDSELPKTLCLE